MGERSLQAMSCPDARMLSRAWQMVSDISHCPGAGIADEELRAVQKFDRDEFGPPKKMSLQNMCYEVKVSCSVMSDSWPPHGL